MGQGVPLESDRLGNRVYDRIFSLSDRPVGLQVGDRASSATPSLRSVWLSRRGTIVWVEGAIGWLEVFRLDSGIAYDRGGDHNPKEIWY
jgi:hypothetical protein